MISISNTPSFGSAMSLSDAALKPNLQISKDQIEKWLTLALADTVSLLNLEPDWWPSSNPGSKHRKATPRPNSDPREVIQAMAFLAEPDPDEQSNDSQSDATVWAIAFFLEALEDMITGSATVYCSKGKEDENRKIFDAEMYKSEKVFKTDELIGGKFNYLRRNQLMLDFVAGQIENPDPILVSGESEMKTNESVDNLGVGKGYLWDFFKLLVVPSRVRLFVARVGPHKQINQVDRMKLLAENMMKMRTQYEKCFSLQLASFAIVIIPKEITDLSETIILWSSTNGDLQCGKVSEETVLELCSRGENMNRS